MKGREGLDWAGTLGWDPIPSVPPTTAVSEGDHWALLSSLYAMLPNVPPCLLYTNAVSWPDNYPSYLLSDLVVFHLSSHPLSPPLNCYFTVVPFTSSPKPTPLHLLLTTTLETSPFSTSSHLIPHVTSSPLHFHSSPLLSLMLTAVFSTL